MIKIRDNIKNIDISKLKEYEKNNKIHTQEQISLLVQIIDRFGFTTPLLIDKDYNIIAGHGRKLAGERLGMKKLPCILIDDLSEDEIKTLRIADNRIGELAETSFINIQEEYLSLKDSGSGIEFLTGYTEEDFDFLTDGDTNEVEEDDFEVPEDVEEIKTDIKQGDIIQLGNHRLMCGDSTKEEDVSLLMNGNKADMVFTDPPYGYSYESNHQKKHTMLKNDDKILDFINSSYIFVKDNSSYYICLGWQKLFEWLNLITNYELKLKNIIVWKKNNWSMGDLKGAYAGQHELILFLHKGRVELLLGRDRDVWEFNREPPSLHPTMKPINLCSKGILNTSKEKDIVLDLFGGSGSTLIACEQLNRQCYMMELDPKYCEVICQRWEKLTNKQRVKLN